MSDIPKKTEPSIGAQWDPGIDPNKWELLQAEFEGECEAALQDFERSVKFEFEARARRQMKSSYMKYIDGLSYSHDDDNVTVTINGWLPVALEEGADPFDMKAGLLAGNAFRVIRMENGNFRTVSTNSPPDSWWHPGLEARNIIDQVKEEEHDIAEETVIKRMQAFLRKHGVE